MKRHAPLRPRMYAESIEACVARAIADGGVLDVAAEAKRIAAETGLSQAIIAQELAELGIRARLSLEFPPSASLDGHQHLRKRGDIRRPEPEIEAAEA